VTTIAYKDGVLACDSAWSEDSRIIGLINKIRRFDTGVLYGGAGAADDRALLNLLHKVTHPNDLPPYDTIWEIQNSVTAIVVFPDGRVFEVSTGDDDCGVCPLDSPAAVGSGKWIAIGAMEAGASAVEAVEIACKRDCHSKGPVHSLALK
jgi:ATP-dependent protease HslVU (ClpYQ) peptidase subunit